MIVLSLFDGISCGQIALERAGIKVDAYYASEIKKTAIKVTKLNYPKHKIYEFSHTTPTDISNCCGISRKCLAKIRHAKDAGVSIKS